VCKRCGFGGMMFAHGIMEPNSFKMRVAGEAVIYFAGDTVHWERAYRVHTCMGFGTWMH